MQLVRLTALALFWGLLLRQALGADRTVDSTSVQAVSIIDLQTHRTIETSTGLNSSGKPLTIRLINLNPAINSQFLLEFNSRDKSVVQRYHIENPFPLTQSLRLMAGGSAGLLLSTGNSIHPCLFGDHATMQEAHRMPLAFVPLCDTKLYVRNSVEGSRTLLESTTQFLRDHIWRGEQIVGFVRREFFQDAYIERSAAMPAQNRTDATATSFSAPPTAKVNLKTSDTRLMPTGLGIDTGSHDGYVPGHWYTVLGMPGVYVSTLQPRSVQGDFKSDGDQHSVLDPVEAQALVFLVAFDTSQFELGFALGTEHPRLGWSVRARTDQIEAGTLGPDGINTASPLARAGMLNPSLLPRVSATFTGGFKREHGAFRYGALASSNHASHYGFVEQGVTYSRLVPGLATLYVLMDGSIVMKTWTRDEELTVHKIRHARQNGVPLIDRNRTDGTPEIGALVNSWGSGNWSGSADEKLRTLRAGACIVHALEKTFLIYGYFSSSTPRTMASVFRAYGCSYAMHLDMNALEHTYLALYPHVDSHITVEYLVKDMSVVDRTSGPTVAPRFLTQPSDRDFFYLLRKEEVN